MRFSAVFDGVPGATKLARRCQGDQSLIMRLSEWLVLLKSNPSLARNGPSNEFLSVENSLEKALAKVQSAEAAKAETAAKAKAEGEEDKLDEEDHDKDDKDKGDKGEPSAAQILKEKQDAQAKAEADAKAAAAQKEADAEQLPVCH